tara:strand:+ start:17 stop:754 length:738 start_codon:yes stop_codon:yes gene_type:complete
LKIGRGESLDQFLISGNFKFSLDSTFTFVKNQLIGQELNLRYFHYKVRISNENLFGVIKISILRARLQLPLVLCLGLFCTGIYSTKGQGNTVQTTGDILLFAMPAAALTSTLAVGDSQGTWQFAKGFTLNQALTIGLKHAIDKKRPFGNGDKAFPSGHTSTTFQSASFIQRRYGWKYGIPAYALAGFTGFSRLNAKKHDGWDVLAGAVIGIGSTYLFTSPYQQEHMQLTFANDKNGQLLGFVYKF